MQLNPDCVRDILLYLEEKLTILDGNKFSKVELKDIYEAFENTYSKEDIFYSVYNLHQIRFIEGRIENVTNQKMFFCEIENISWNGHQFLNTVRPKSIWDATKTKAKQIGGMSLQTLSTIAVSIMQAVATNPDFIQNIVNTLK